MYYKRDLESKIEQYLESSKIIAIFEPKEKVHKPLKNLLTKIS